MPVPVQQFQRGPGVLAGISAGQNIMQRLLTDPTKRNLLQAQLEQQQLLSQEQREKLKTLPQTLQAQLEFAQARPAYLQAETAFTQAGVPLRGQQTALAAEQVKYMPLLTGIKAQQAVTAAGQLGQSKSRFSSPLYNWKQLMYGMTPAQRLNYAIQHPKAFEQVKAQALQSILYPKQQDSQAQTVLTPEFLQRFGLGGGVSQPQTGAPRGAPVPTAGMPFETATQSVSPLLMQSQQQTAPQPQPLSTTSTLPPGVKVAPPLLPGVEPVAQDVSPTEPQIKKAVTLEKIELNRKLSPVQQQNKLAAARAVTGLLNRPHMRELINLGMQYSGLFGKISGKELAISNPNLYAKLQNLEGPAMTLLQGNLKTMEGLASTQEGMELGRNYFAKFRDQIKSDPVAALVSFNNLIGMLDDDKAAIQTVAQPGYKVDFPAAEHKIRPFTLPGKRPPRQRAGMVSVIKPDGKRGSVPENQLTAALNAGYRRAQ